MRLEGLQQEMKPAGLQQMRQAGLQQEMRVQRSSSLTPTEWYEGYVSSILTLMESHGRKGSLSPTLMERHGEKGLSSPIPTETQECGSSSRTVAKALNFNVCET